MTIQFEIHGNIALAAVDRPPVNAIDASVRAGLLDAVRRFAGDDSLRALVIACRGRTFLSGADLTELESGIPDPPYAEVLGALESSAKPVIAVLHGTALGGGLEIAMACHYRCATPSARMGMPEITLGILPGAGGTQRLPRLVGTADALELLLQGAPIDAKKAKDLGLIDEIVGDDPIAAGLAYAASLVSSGAAPRPTGPRTERLKALDDAQLQSILDRHARALRGRTTQQFVIKALRAATQMPFEAGLRYEATLSAESLRTPESLALRHVFFAERECARVPGIDSTVRTPAVKRVAVIGAGTMGSGIAMALSDAGIDTVLVERDQQGLDRGLAMIRANYEGSVKRGRIDAATAQEREQRIRPVVGFEPVREVDLAIEAVFEDFELKRSVLEGLDSLLPPHAIIASNTSSLSLGALARATHRPEHVVGLHFFSPANVMRLLEIVRSPQTSHETIAAALALAKTLRKIGVVVGDGFGFVGNRMMLDGYFREAELLLLQGVPPARIDAVMESFGFAMGPNRVNDMAGVDVGTRVRAELARRETREPPYHVVSDALTTRGRFGQKTGRGIYRYEPGDRNPQHDPELATLIGELASKYRIASRDVSDTEIETRCVLSLVNVGANILAEGLAYRASDIDVIWTSGYGFPRSRGGPMHFADSLGLDTVVERIRAVASNGGGSYWNVSPLLLELARDGRSFADFDRGRRTSAG